MSVSRSILGADAIGCIEGAEDVFPVIEMFFGVIFTIEAPRRVMVLLRSVERFLRLTSIPRIRGMIMDSACPVSIELVATLPEVVLRLYAERLHFFAEGWNWLDATVVLAPWSSEPGERG